MMSGLHIHRSGNLAFWGNETVVVSSTAKAQSSSKTKIHYYHPVDCSNDMDS